MTANDPPFISGRLSPHRDNPDCPCYACAIRRFTAEPPDDCCPHGRRFYDECHPCHLCADCERDMREMADDYVIVIRPGDDFIPLLRAVAEATDEEGGDDD